MEYLDKHIPGAVFFDIDALSDTENPLPHMLPSPEKFSSRMRKMGIGDGHRVVVYDQQGIYSAARVWWMFRLFGHDDVAVLDGGLPKWMAEGRPTNDEEVDPKERHFTVLLSTPWENTGPGEWGGASGASAMGNGLTDPTRAAMLPPMLYPLTPRRALLLRRRELSTETPSSVAALPMTSKSSTVRVACLWTLVRRFP